MVSSNCGNGRFDGMVYQIFKQKRLGKKHVKWGSGGGGAGRVEQAGLEPEYWGPLSIWTASHPSVTYPLLHIPPCKLTWVLMVLPISGLLSRLFDSFLLFQIARRITRGHSSCSALEELREKSPGIEAAFLVFLLLENEAPVLLWELLRKLNSEWGQWEEATVVPVTQLGNSYCYCLQVAGGFSGWPDFGKLGMGQGHEAIYARHS